MPSSAERASGTLPQVKALAAEAGVRFLTLGFDPTSATEDVPIMPKNRYDIMRAYMPTKGTLGLDMMLRSCTIQVRPRQWTSGCKILPWNSLSSALLPKLHSCTMLWGIMRRHVAVR